MPARTTFRDAAKFERQRAEQASRRATAAAKERGAAPGGLWDARRGHDRPDAVLAADGHLGYADRLTWPSAVTPTRRRRIVAGDVHRFILVDNRGQTFRAAIVPTWPSSGVLANAPAQSLHRRPRPTRFVADVFDPHVPHRRTISGPLQISTMGRLYQEFGVTSPVIKSHPEQSPQHCEWAMRTTWKCVKLFGRRVGGGAIADRDRRILGPLSTR
jgi:hypothetical protein